MDWWEIPIVVIIIYIVAGILFNFLLFMWAKTKGLDEVYEEWDVVLNSFGGLIYLHVLGSFIWFPMLIYLRKEKKGYPYHIPSVYQRLKLGLQKMLFKNE